MLFRTALFYNGATPLFVLKMNPYCFESETVYSNAVTQVFSELRRVMKNQKTDEMINVCAFHLCDGNTLSSKA